MGLFVVALVVVGALLLNGSGDDNDQDDIAAAADDTATTTVAGITQPTTPVDGQRATETAADPVATSTSTSTSASEPTTTTASESTVTTADSEEPTEAPTDEPTEEPVEPEPTDTPQPEPTEAPVVGEFGELPPAQVVSGGVSRSLSLDYELAATLDAVPSTAPVFRLEWPAWSEDDVAAMAQSLGIEGSVEGSGNTWEVSGATGQLFVSPREIQYVLFSGVAGSGLPDDGQILDVARSWLFNHGLISGETGGGAIIGRDDDTGRAVVLFKPANPSPLLAFIPSATVTVGPDATVLEANIRWPAGYTGSDYGLRSANEMWNEVLSGAGALEADLGGVGGDGPLSGLLTITDISVVYSYAGSPASGEYLVPLIVFSGQAQLNEVDASVLVSIYVPAVFGESAPRG